VTEASVLFSPNGRVHFIGIGGAGMSAIAKVLVERGVVVSGSDLKKSRSATMLAAMGCDLHLGHDARHVKGAEVVVVSSAIPPSNPELSAAREQGLKVLTRGEALAALLSEGRSIAVAGTHGKTTTTSMIVSIFRNADLDPTYLVGGGLNDVGTNARYGHGEWALAESDESDGSFLLLTPTIAVVTNVEADHVDHWTTLDQIRDAFGDFLKSTRPEGAIVVPADDEDLIDRARMTGRRLRTFGRGGDVTASDVTGGISGSSFTVDVEGRRLPASLQVPGAHNVSNALAAIAAAVEAGVAPEEAVSGVGSFHGVERRFQIRGEVRGVTVIDDYAHHPTEVAATIETARPGPWRRVVAVFQPHRYSRTAAFAHDFGRAFAQADRVVITDVYGAGEQPVPGVTGKLIADAACTSWPGRPVAYLPHRGELIDYLSRSLTAGDLLLTMGAGDVTTVGEQIMKQLERA
jgi:UDP-N-acetylmuramate--alanine ligase